MLTAMLDSKYRGRRKGIPVRDGSVRQARKEAHLSLAQVAGRTVSRTAIHLIETGRTRPSLETLEQIARQTHKPVEFFLLSPNGAPELTERRKDMVELERLTLLRDFEKVIDIAPLLLAKDWGDDDNALIHFYWGQACCRVVRPKEALLHLGLMEDPRAILLAGEALIRCRRLDPKPPQTEARILGHIANMYVVAHAWGEGVRFYEAAVEAAGSVKDLLQLAKMHHGMGLAYQRMQQPVKARQQFDKAHALYSIESDLTAIYRLENDLGDLLLQQGHLDSAEERFRAALAGSTALQMDRRGRGFILANLGDVSLRRGQLEQARQQLIEALGIGSAVGEHVVVANAHTLLGQLEAQQGDLELAREHFDSAIRALEPLDMPDRLRDCHIACAELLYEHGDIESAALHWKAAAEIGRVGAASLRSNPELAQAAEELLQGTASTAS